MLLVVPLALGREETCSAVTGEDGKVVGTGDSVKAAQWERNIAHTTPFTAGRFIGAMV